MYLCQGFCITVISGDQEFAELNAFTIVLPTAPCQDWVAASQLCGLIKCNICFLKEKIHLLCHSLPFTMVSGIMVVHMVLHIIKFVNGFPHWGGVKHFSPGKIMMGCCLHKSDIALSFGGYCQVAENVQPRNSLAPRTRATSSLGSSGNLSRGQIFLALDTGHTIIRHQWVPRPMPPAVIDHVNLLGRCEHAMLTFTNRKDHNIGDSSPQDANSVGILDGNLIIIHPAVEIPGVDATMDPAEIAGVDTAFDVTPIGVDMDTNAWAMDTDVRVGNSDITTDGLEQ